MNITGGETLLVKEIATRFAALMDKQPVIEGVPSDTALLSDASLSTEKFGAPKMPIERIIQLISHWVMNGKPVLDKPTHYDARNGSF